GLAINKDAGEVREFQTKDFTGAAAAYKLALEDARQAEEKCELLLAFARALIKAGAPQEALEIYRNMLRGCGQATDDAGIPFTLYAADRLITLKLDVPFAQDYLVRYIRADRLRPLPQSYMIRSLLESIGTNVANRALVEIAGQIADVQQFLTLTE